MRQISSLEYLSMPKLTRWWYKFCSFFLNIPRAIGRWFRSLPSKFAALGQKIGDWFRDIWDALRFGNWKTRLSALIWGTGNFAYRQIGRGLLFLIYEIAFILFMVFFGGKYLAKLGTLGDSLPVKQGSVIIQLGDNSFDILLYSMLTIVVIAFTAVVMFMSLKDAYNNQLGFAIAKRAATSKDDMGQLLNHKFHLTILAFPSLTLAVFTVVPLMFMILVAFTNYNRNNMPPNHLFTWVGFDNFRTILTGQAMNATDAQQAAKFGRTFWYILGWTMEWAILATVTNLFIGMIVALLINKKSIRLKKFWRTCLVTVVAVPQFIALLLVSKMFKSDGGIINSMLFKIGLIPSYNSVKWLDGSTDMAKAMVVIINIWVGVPHTVLTCTGILMNIPDDLYEAARIDGANPYKMFSKITLPYMMFVLGPSLITTFVGNINNFNLIFLLTGGSTVTGAAQMDLAVGAGDVDLLITWLYKLTVNEARYDVASVIGILIFIVVAFFSLIVYSRIGSVKNEEDFQ